MTNLNLIDNTDYNTVATRFIGCIKGVIHHHPHNSSMQLHFDFILAQLTQRLNQNSSPQLTVKMNKLVKLLPCEIWANYRFGADDQNYFSTGNWGTN